MFAPRVRAVLGPTNTGKTHLAITRLLAHASGIIGFPLRLLARENYDRMVAAKGEKYVALITGEEKIVPPEARWFACTVEAMPLDRRAEFVAVDEIQLCADADRGHIFTDRLLHARGMVETMFLGAETIRPLLQRLVPQAEIETRPRLSQLTHSGPAKLTKLPPRSAVVAFSAAEVYAIAEAIRRRRGGCAVVMGRMSPRTRNAQVALYQNREVDFLVATDAIGMGLNMDVDHIAFADLQKFDGHQIRALNAQEAAQIAGRAGRGMRDGTFGTTAECPPLPEELARQIEGHAFEPLTQIAWRNSDLDFASIDGLLDSLAATPPTPGLSKGNDAVDHITLNALSREQEIRQLGQGRARVRLLWEACQVPDFRKIADDSHTRLCAKIFGHLATEGRLPSDWVAGNIAALGNVEGDLDTLMARLANIRIWSYIAARADWISDAATQQAEARKAEEAVSDALHERLIARFVDRRAAHLIRRLDDTEETLLSAVTRQGEVVVEGHTVGKVTGFHFQPDPEATKEEDKRLVLRAARRALREEIPRRLAALETAKDEAFRLTPQHRVVWDEAEIARLRPGPEPLKPHVDVIATEFLDNAQRERVRVRLAAWLDSLVKRELGGLEAIEAKAAEDNTLRGPAFRLREAMGLAPGATEREIPADLRARLKAIGIRAGRYAMYLPDVLKPRAMGLRAQLWALRRNIPTPLLPNPGLVSVTLPETVPESGAEDAAADPNTPRGPEGWPQGFAIMAGWLPAGRVLLRLDVAERIAGELGYLTRRAPAPVPEGLASRLGVKGDTLPMALEAMGFRLMPSPPLEEGEFGPPLPARISVVRQDRAGPRGPRRDGRPERNESRGDQPRGERGAPRGPRPDRAPRPEGTRPEGPRPVYFGPPIPPELRPARPEGPRREGPRRDAPRRERVDHGPRRDWRVDGLPPGVSPPPEAAADAQRPDRSGPDRSGQDRPRHEGPRRGPPRGPNDRPQGGAPRPEGAPQEARRDDRGPRPDRGPDRGPNRGPDRGGKPGGGDRYPRQDRDRGGDRGGDRSAPREWSSGPKPDSPFAVLAQLKLRKD
ncbi:DNA helicase [Roseomonas frigidaquae]|uniref:DNA helicase n=1 Tax=Falsiroseomonas frigidaquae TaxID=487318 RepID=A0ABX1ES92_9PROT|nr:DNA helicase [Falsiroseomonas frigidaquae]